MNAVVDLMRAHRSIRRFKDEPVSKQQLETMLLAGQSASTSTFMQATTVISVTDKAVREQMAELSHQQRYVADAPAFMIFCLDLQRHHQICPDAELGYAEQFLTGAVDVGLFAQNVILAAESMGLGAVFIGAIRNHPEEFITLLQLPEHVFPLFGFCVGYPDQDPALKPRLPLDLIWHQEIYQPLDQDLLKQYDEDVLHYYQHIRKLKEPMTWSQQMQKKFAGESRPFMLSLLKKQGFLTK